MIYTPCSINDKHVAEQFDHSGIPPLPKAEHDVVLARIPKTAIRERLRKAYCPVHQTTHTARLHEPMS